MVKIVVDSGCDLRREHIENEECRIDYVPLNLQCEDRVYVDDDSLDINAFMEHMESSPVGVKSASPSPSLFMDKYTGSESVFVVTLSSKLSGTYNNAVMAKNMYLEECGKKFIHVFDSLSASVGEGVIALKIADFASKGFNNIEIVEHVNNFIKSMRTYFIIDRFDTLVKTGRINPYVAKVASMLNIKPICGGDRDGNITMFDKARGYSKAAKRLIEIIRENTPDIEQRVAAISHAKCIEKALAFKEELLATLHVKDVVITEATGLITTYANRGGLVVAL